MAKTLRKPELADWQEFINILRADLSPLAVAAYIMWHPCEVAFSHMVENYAEEGTFAAAVFTILSEA